MAQWTLAAMLVCVAGLGTASLSAATEEQTDWREYVSEAGRFSVELPDQPRQSHWTRNTWGGEVESAEFGVETDDVRLRIETHDMPRIARWVMSPLDLLKRASRGLMDDDGGEVVGTRKFEVQNHPAWEVSYRIADSPEDDFAETGAIGLARFVLVADRVYLLSTVHRSGRAPEAAITRFLDSFQFWPN